MYFTSSIQIYDALELVVWVVQIREWSGSDTDEPDHVVLRLHGEARGEGLDNPTRWLRAVLEDIRESL